MNKTFTIASRFHPAYSLLGRWIHLRVDDRRRAESLFIVAAGIIALVLVLSQYLGWAMLEPSDRDLSFLVFQVVIAGLYAIVCLIGRQPEISVAVTKDAVEITWREPSSLLPWTLQRDEQVTRAPFRRVGKISTIDAEVYYRHYARYAGTRAFVNRIPAKLAMIDLQDGPIIIGLEPDDLVAFLEAIEDRTSVGTPSRVA